MEGPEVTNEWMIYAAMKYLEMGYRPIPLGFNTKAAAVSWKEFQTRFPDEAEVECMFGDNVCNIGLLTGIDLVVVDVDDPTLLSAVIEHCGDTPQKSRTPRGGFHLYYGMRKGVTYGGAVKIKGKALDLRCEKHYVVAPWSRTSDGKYEWLGEVFPPSELPLLKVSWLRDRRPTPQMKPITDLVSQNQELTERRVRAWLAHVEGSISGSGGHKVAMRVAGKLIQQFRLEFDRAFRCMKEWSDAQCEPPWSDAEIIHKLKSAVDNMHKYVRKNP